MIELEQLSADSGALLLITQRRINRGRHGCFIEIPAQKLVDPSGQPSRISKDFGKIDASGSDLVIPCACASGWYCEQ